MARRVETWSLDGRRSEELYRGSKLFDFSLYAVPTGWMVHQPVESKTISVVLKP